MDRRFGLRIGGAFAVLTCAALVACGGGGGGGSTGGGSVIPTAVPSATATPITAQTQALSLSGPTTFSLGAAGSMSSTSLVFPAAASATTLTVSVSGTLPSAAPIVPQAHAMLHPMTLGGSPTTLEYITLQSSAAFTEPTVPAVTAVLASPLATGGYADIAYYTSGQGWISIREVTVSAGATSITFPSAAFNPPLTMNAGQVYAFAIVTNATPLQTPTPAPTALASPRVGTDPVIPNQNPTKGWGPYQVANAFQFPVLSGFSGKGETIAIIGYAVPSASDLTSYLSGLGITSSIHTGTYTPVYVAGTPSPDPAGLDEATLDVETVAGLAPGANIRFYAIPDLTDTSFISGYNAVLTDKATYNIVAFSISFGGCEGYNGANYTSADSPVLANLAAAGIAVVASSGDQGNQCYLGGPAPAPTFSPGVNYPASDPSVIGVGGTETNLASNITSTAVWSDANGAGGGGVSAVFTYPPQQVGVTGFASASMRNVPDIALPAVDAYIVENGGPVYLDGTSWSAPQSAALLAELNEYCGGSIATSFSTPQALFYKAYSRRTADFVDVATGTNYYSSAPAGTPFAALTGPDNVSGVGIPLGMPIAQTLCANGTPQSVRVNSLALRTQGYGPMQNTALDNVVRMPGLHDLGLRANGTPTRVTLVLRSNPSLSSDLRTVASQLQAAGFTVTSASGMVIQAVAPAATVGAYFGTSIHDVEQHGVTRYANLTGVTIPAAIAPYVQGVVTNDLILARHFIHRRR